MSDDYPTPPKRNRAPRKGRVQLREEARIKRSAKACKDAGLVADADERKRILTAIARDEGASPGDRDAAIRTLNAMEKGEDGDDGLEWEQAEQLSTAQLLDVIKGRAWTRKAGAEDAA